MNIKIMMMAAVAALSVSCTEDFLTADPVLAQSPDTYYSNDDQMYSALVASYDPLNYCALCPLGYMVPFSEICSDNANTGLGGDNEKTEIRDVEMLDYNDVNLMAKMHWLYGYMGINRCNYVINAEYTSDVTEVYKAEAHFLRAWYLFNLQRTFGPCVIPLKTSYPMTEPFVRASREEVNAQIEADLEVAIAGCDDKPAQTGRITKSAARALLAKHYIYAADWDNDNAATFSKAIPVLEQVISEGNYSFCNYTEMFNYEYRNNKESIFEIQTSTIAAGRQFEDQPHALDAGMWGKWVGCRGLSWHPDYANGMWGGMFLTKDLYDYYIDGDTTRRDETFITEAEFMVGEKGFNGKEITWNQSLVNLMDWEGYDQKKFVTYRSTPYTGVVYNQSFANVQVIRLSEVYLMLAEAYLRGNGDEAKAKELIDAVRAAHEPNATYKTVDEIMAYDPARFPSVLEVLWYERRVEFAGEGDRRYDLIRSGRFEEVMTKFLATGRLHKNKELVWDNTMNYLPIFFDETQACPTLTTYPDEAYE